MSEIRDDFERLGLLETPGIGTLLLDPGLYRVFENDVLMLSLSTEPCGQGVVFDISGNCVLNHRYPNRRYITVTSKHGRKLARHGVFLQLPLEKFNRFGYLNLYVCDPEKMSLQMTVPIRLWLTPDKPFAGMELRVMTNEIPTSVQITTCDGRGEVGWLCHEYTTSRYRDSDHTLLRPVDVVVDGIAWKRIPEEQRITLRSCILDELFV